MSETIGFVGLGNMGAAMARNLRRAGYELRLHNRTAARAETLAEEIGATACATSELAARGAAYVLTMVPDDATIEAVTTGERGILAGLAPGAIHLSASTISPDISRRLAAAHGAHGSHYLATPVFGRPPAAEAAKLHVLLSGADAETRARVRPVLEVIGQSVWDFGDDAGAANVAKVCGNFLIFAATQAMAEAFTLAEKNGLERTAVYTMLTDTIFNTAPYKSYGAMVASEVYEPVGFALPLALKDVRLFEALGQATQTPLPTANLLDQRLVAALANGNGHLDAAAFALETSAAAGLRRDK